MYELVVVFCQLGFGRVACVEKPIMIFREASDCRYYISNEFKVGDASYAYCRRSRDKVEK